MNFKIQRKNLGNLVTHKKGFAFKSKDYTPTGVPVVRVSNFTWDSISTEDLRFVGNETANSNKVVSLKKYDVIIATVGSWPQNPASIVGKVVRVPQELSGSLLNQNTVRLRVISDNIIDQRYLYIALKNNEFSDYLISKAQGSANQASITLSDIFSYDIPWGSSLQRKFIVDIIDSINDKIIINNHINRTLEQMAQSLFKSWFVDFEPVKAKIAVLEAGGTQEDATLAAMTAISGKDADAMVVFEHDHSEQYAELKATAELFPSAMQDSELGEIPKGWETPAVQDVANTVKGKSYKSTELDCSKTALVTLKSFNRGGGYRLDGLKEYTGKYKPDQEVFAGDLIIAYTDVTQAAEVIGKPAMVISDIRYEHLVISLDVAVVRPFNDCLKYYLYGVARTEQFQQHTNSHSTGTTVLHLSKNAVPSYKFILANKGLVNIYARHAKSIFSKVNTAIEENKYLSELRDILLPKLLSGEITLPEAERAVSEAKNV
ncbi:restriction endonuclease subunit S [uncultured Cedecea sp.]|uniref:restriction endonuclease subunit S n=1 Tax=uncultured Cedecea sp. TaxID=988762 RepID=UPI00261C658A|nr:restriction endonuclease subunit S [uncultured Cedecea sp.]